MIPQANLVGLPHVHRQAARIGTGVGIPRLHAEHVRDAQRVHLVRAPIGTHVRLNIIDVLLVDLEPTGNLHQRLHRVLVEVRQPLLGSHDPRHTVNADLEISGRGTVVERKTRRPHHVGQVIKSLWPCPITPVIGHFSIMRNKNARRTVGGTLEFAEHRPHDGRHEWPHPACGCTIDAVGCGIINICRQLNQSVDVGRVGVGRINLDASRDRIGRAEEEVVLRDRKFRVPQPGDADVRVHQRLPNRVDIVGRLGGRVGQELRFYTGPQHRVGGAVDELVRRPVGLGVVPGVPVVGVVDVDLPTQCRRGVDA